MDSKGSMIPAVVFVFGPLSVSIDLEAFPLGVKVTVDGPAGRLTGRIEARDPADPIRAADLPQIAINALKNYKRGSTLVEQGTPDDEIAETLNAEADARAKKAREGLN